MHIFKTVVVCSVNSEVEDKSAVVTVCSAWDLDVQ